MPLKLLVDTCVWLDLAQDYREQPVVAALEELVRQGEVKLLIPQQVLEEFNRNKLRVVSKATEDLQSYLRIAKQAVARFGDEGTKDATLQALAEVDRAAVVKGEAVHNSLERIEALLKTSRPLKATKALKARVTERALAKRAPFHQGKLNIGDAILVESYADAVGEPPDFDVQFGFVTHNFKDFSEPTGDRRKPHGDIAELFDFNRSRYFTTLTQAIQWADPVLLADHEVEFNHLQNYRRLSEIYEAEYLLFRQVWYNRHWNLRAQIEEGTHHVVAAKDYATKPFRNDQTLDSVWKQALAAARRTEKEVGLENLGPWTDFEWGMINGKLSALRWVTGDDWDMLDT